MSSISSYKGRVLVTGSTSGFGQAIARHFAAHHWQVIGTGRRLERLNELKAELGDAFIPLCFDVSKREEVQAALQTLDFNQHPLDVLINNAGLALGLGAADEVHWEDWETMVQTNINGVLYMTKAVLPFFVDQKGGLMINISSVAASYSYPGSNVYGATKAFLTQFSLNLRADLVKKGIRVTSIEPGLAETEFSVVRFKGNQEKADAVYQGTKPILPQDIAEMCYWVASLPKHLNINRLEVMAGCQGFGPFQVVRGDA